jgi:hypothetical protein
MAASCSLRFPDGGSSRSVILLLPLASSKIVYSMLGSSTMTVDWD